MSSAEVDEFIETRLSAEHQDIAAAQRELMARSAPEAQELIDSGSPAWKGRKILDRGVLRPAGATSAQPAGQPPAEPRLHMAAVTQVRKDTPGRAYYLRKQAEGKGRKEALRALKRRISDATPTTRPVFVGQYVAAA
jgi:hypothetical protein